MDRRHCKIFPLITGVAVFSNQDGQEAPDSSLINVLMLLPDTLCYCATYPGGATVTPTPVSVCEHRVQMCCDDCYLKFQIYPVSNSRYHNFWDVLQSRKCAISLVVPQMLLSFVVRLTTARTPDSHHASIPRHFKLVITFKGRDAGRSRSRENMEQDSHKLIPKDTSVPVATSSLRMSTSSLQYERNGGESKLQPNFSKC
jgi:hypothetical protein